KKGVHGVDAILDGLSGGSFVQGANGPGSSRLGSFLVFNGLPIVVVAFVIYLLSRRGEKLTPAALALAIVPLGVFLGCAERHAQFVTAADVPRVFITAVLALALVSPRRCRDLFGLDTVHAVALVTLAVGSDWAMEMSAPGRGWSDATSTTIASIFVFFA